MSKTTWAILLGGMLCLPAMATAAGQGADTFVFVGERISIEEAPDPCEDEFRSTGERSCITMDSLYTARYWVLQQIVGAHEGDEIRFRVADHYGFPPFARFRTALLFVAQTDDGPWLHKYQAIPLHRTVDGQWASCGDVARSLDGTPSPALKPLQFQREIAAETDLSESMRQSYAAGGLRHLRIAHGKVWCSQGVLLEDAYRIVRNGVMRARKVPLPDWPGSGADSVAE